MTEVCSEAAKTKDRLDCKATEVCGCSECECLDCWCDRIKKMQDEEGMVADDSQ